MCVLFQGFVNESDILKQENLQEPLMFVQNTLCVFFVN